MTLRRSRRGDERESGCSARRGGGLRALDAAARGVRRWLVLGALFGACNATETGNPAVPSQLALAAYSSTPDVVVGAAGDRLRVEHAWVGIGDVRLVRADQCEGGDTTEIDLPGPVVRDLASAPEVFELATMDGSFCRVRVRLERVDGALPSGAPAALRGRSLVIEGRTAAGVSFQIASRLHEEADVRSRSLPFTLDDRSRALVMGFDVATWLDGLDLDRAAAGADMLLIDDDHHRELLDAFEDNVERALRLFRDRDADGALDEDERTDVLAEG